MGHLFNIHNDFGRLFDEEIYKKELADRMRDVILELEVTVTHGSFSKTYYVDTLVNSSGFFGGDERVLLPVSVINSKGHLTFQKMRLVAGDVGLRLTALRERLDEFERQERKLLRHTSLEAIHWVNITQTTVQFVTLT